MGWESGKSGRRYYTRSKRVGGRVVREYIGSGAIAQSAATLDYQARQQRQTETANLTKIRKQDSEREGQLQTYYQSLQARSDWMMLVADCHRPQRQWRKKRDKGS